MAEVRTWGGSFVVPTPRGARSLELSARWRRRAARRRAPRREMHALIAELYPICRSITGDGVRETLRSLGRAGRRLEVHEVPTGTPVFDWTVPREWNIRDAWVEERARRAGHRLPAIEPARVSYSVPVRATCRSPSCGAHLHSRSPSIRTGSRTAPPTTRRTGASAWRTAQLEALPEGEYEVVHRLARSRTARSPTASASSRARRRDEVLISCHVCHPSLCNDNLSGRGARGRACRAARAGSALRYSLPLPLHPGHHRARSPGWRGTRRGSARSGTAWCCACVGDAGAALQAQPARRRRDRPRGGSTCCGRRARARGARLLALRLRRAPVLLAGVRPAGRLPDRGRRTASSRSTTPRPTTSTSSGRRRSAESLGAASSDRRRAGAQRPLPEPEPEGRAAAGEARALRGARRDIGRQARQLALLWVLNLRTAGIRCSTSPSGRGWGSRRSRRRRRRWWRTTCWRRHDGGARDRGERRDRRGDRGRAGGGGGAGSGAGAAGRRGGVRLASGGFRGRGGRGAGGGGAGGGADGARRAGACGGRLRRGDGGGGGAGGSSTGRGG